MMKGETTLKDLGIEFKSTKSEDAFRKIHERLKPGLENWLFNMTKDRDQAKHFTSLALSTAYEKIDQYNPKWHISTWIYRIAYINFCLELRSNKRTGVNVANVNMVGLGGDDVPYQHSSKGRDLDRALHAEWERGEQPPTEQEMLVDHVPDAISGLPPDLRRAVQLKFYDGKSVVEAADAMGITCKEFNALIRVAKKSVKASLSPTDAKVGEVRSKYGHLRETGRIVYPYSRKVLSALAAVYGVQCHLNGIHVVVRGAEEIVHRAMDRLLSVDASIRLLQSEYSKSTGDRNPTEYMNAICAAVVQSLGQKTEGRASRTLVEETDCARKAVADAASVVALVGFELKSFTYGQQEFRLPMEK